MGEAPQTLRTAMLEGGTVLHVTLDHPKGNVLSTLMMTELGGALSAHRHDPHLKLVLLTAQGANFSFGASVPEHQREAAPGMLRAFHALVRMVASYPVPIASVVEGRCLGGAFELVLASHFVFATPSAVFACPEIKLGVIPPVLSVLGHHRLGGPLTEQMLLTGQELDARGAHACGFVAEVLPADARTDEWALDWYRKQLGPLSAVSLREAVHAARQGSGMLTSLAAPLETAERRYVELLVPSHDGNEGILAFLEKRAPKWTDG